MTTHPQTRPSQPSFRLIDFAEALSGPYEMPQFDARDPDGWARAVLPWLQQRLLSHAYGLEMGAPRAERPALNAPLSLNEVADVVLSIGAFWADLLEGARRLVAASPEGLDFDPIERVLSGHFYTATLSHVVQELERRHGERAMPRTARLH